MTNTTTTIREKTNLTEKVLEDNQAALYFAGQSHSPNTFEKILTERDTLIREETIEECVEALNTIIRETSPAECLQLYSGIREGRKAIEALTNNKD